MNHVSLHQKRMQQIMTQCFFAVKSKLDRRLGLFDLIGCDFMVDTDFKVRGQIRIILNIWIRFMIFFFLIVSAWT